MTFDEYWTEAQHHVNAEYHAALEVWKEARKSAMIECMALCHRIAVDQRRSSLMMDGAFLCKEKIGAKLKEEVTTTPGYIPPNADQWNPLPEPADNPLKINKIEAVPNAALEDAPSQEPAEWMNHDNEGYAQIFETGPHPMIESTVLHTAPQPTPSHIEHWVSRCDELREQIAELELQLAKSEQSVRELLQDTKNEEVWMPTLGDVLSLLIRMPNHEAYEQVKNAGRLLLIQKQQIAKLEDEVGHLEMKLAHSRERYQTKFENDNY